MLLLLHNEKLVLEEIYTGDLWQCSVIKSFVTKKEKKKKKIVKVVETHNVGR